MKKTIATLAMALLAVTAFSGQEKPTAVNTCRTERFTLCGVVQEMSISLPAGWQPVGVGDFNQDGYPDVLLWNSTTGQTFVYFLTPVD